MSTSGWRRRVRNEWGQLTGGPLSATWWVARGAFRVVFTEFIFMLLLLLNTRPDVLEGVAAGTAPWWTIPVAIATTPLLLGVFLLVAAVAFALPFLPRRDPSRPGAWR
ncbi:hypothetical protein NDI76_07900 [Halogeometricum sp. S1BR25-6]|uniref:Uncharacterized protein n=1 Tax=Halogeometricum salsisoli TaxID=2950536 RepID=A0ABU2GCZ4_9EURY|nr:hypothetical protein [Halogeometricum sp. S1BR25-6]MDS0298662.1 hypothetical protein [Halogeometricum sp. S1BR25-6]